MSQYPLMFVLGFFALLSCGLLYVIAKALEAAMPTKPKEKTQLPLQPKSPLDQFVERMAAHVVAKSAATLAEAEIDCRNALYEFLNSEKIQFGHRDYDWTEGGAQDLAQDWVLEFYEA